MKLRRCSVLVDRLSFFPSIHAAFLLVRAQKINILINKIVLLLLQFVLLNYIYRALKCLKSKPGDKTDLHQRMSNNDGEKTSNSEISIL